MQFTGLAAMIDADLAAILATEAHVFTYAGQDYPCVLNRPAVGSEPAEGGMWPDYTGRITTRRALFSAVPRQGERVTVDGIIYFIAKVTASEQSPVLEFAFQNTQAPK